MPKNMIFGYSDKNIPSVISVGYELREGENADDLIVWYLKDDGSYESIDCSYLDGILTFETDHNSVYAIMSFTPEKSETSSMIFIITIAPIALLAAAICFFRFKH